MAHPESVGEGEEEHHGSPWPVIIAVGMGVAYVGIVSGSIPLLLAGVVIFAAASEAGSIRTCNGPRALSMGLRRPSSRGSRG